MNEPLRPLNLGEILDRTVNFYRSRFLVFLGISIIPTGAVLVIGACVFVFLAWWGASGASSIPPALAGVLAFVFLAVAGLLALPIVLGVNALASAAMNHAVNRFYLGESITIRDAYKAVWKRGWRYAGLYLLRGLIIWVAPFAAWTGLVLFSAGLTALAASAGMGPSTGVLFGLLAFLVVAALLTYAIVMLLRLCLAFPACVVEQIAAWEAIKRSATLSKGTRGRVFLLYLLVTVLGWLLIGGVTLILTIVMAFIPGASTPQRAQSAALVVMFVYYGCAFAVQALTKPVYGIALVLFYYDQRIRLEGFDIEWMMAKAGLVVPAPAGAEAEREPQPWLPVDGRAPAPAPAETPDAAAAGADSIPSHEAPPETPHAPASEPSPATDAEPPHAALEESS